MEISFSKMKKYFSEKGFFFSDDKLYNLYISLKTKPFVILSGISGSGKSKIIDILAEYLSQELSYNNNYELVPVKPNWTDSRNVFGYHNIIDQTYSITPTVKLFLRALKNPDKPYFLVLDEMNLAKVEHYFSDFLSLIESRKLINNDDIKQELHDEFLIKNMPVSHSIILAAIDINDKEFHPIADYRENRFCKLLGLVNEKIDIDGNDLHTNWKVQFRTEFNQDKNRLAHRVFEKNPQKKGEYRLKNISDMRDSDAKLFNELKDKYNYLLTNISKEPFIDYLRSEISQHPLQLHNNSSVLTTNSQIDKNTFKKIQLKIEQEGFSTQELYKSSHIYSDTDFYLVPPTIIIPQNVFVIGTVNIDETTYMFSPKVLDRANVIEFNEINLEYAFEGTTHDASSSLNLSNDMLNLTTSVPSSNDTKWLVANYPVKYEKIKEIFEILKDYHKHFGYRVFNEISLYIRNYNAQIKNNDDWHDLDNQIIQKILPKLNGDIDDLFELLQQLRDSLPKEEFPNSNIKITEMIKTLENIGYVTFIK